MKNIISLLLSKFIIFTILLISSIVLIESINSISMHSDIYNGKIFLFDITSKGYIKILFVFISITFLLMILSKNDWFYKMFITTSTLIINQKKCTSSSNKKVSIFFRIQLQQ